MSGRLVGVGVGPGDPELLTLKAARLIAEADVVFCPAGHRARAAAGAGALLAGKRLIQLDLEMRGDRARALAMAAEVVARELGGGCGVYLTEGDPGLYSTFELLAAALQQSAPAVRVTRVPGVSSITAAAAAAGMALAMGDQTLAVVPGSAPPALLEDALATFDTTVVVKPSLTEDLGQAVGRLGLEAGAVLVDEATGAGERVLRGAEAMATRSPYFSTLLVPGGRPPGAAGRVHFAGAGPGAAEHLTRRVLALLRRADLVVAADSLVRPEVIGLGRGRVLLSSSLTLEESVPPMIEAARQGGVVVRLHSGDPAIYGAIAEQMALLREAGVAYEVVPGVSSVFAAAAAIGVELTEPGGTQTVILTRHGARVPTPERERLRVLAASRATLAVFLSAASATAVQRELLAAGLDPETPVAIAFRVAWPDQLIERTTLSQLAAQVRRRRLRRHTLILVGEALRPGDRRSRLYDSAHVHVHRPRSGASLPRLPRPPLLVAVTRPGARLARRLASQLPGARLAVSRSAADRGEEVMASASDSVPALFASGVPLVLFMAVGAAVRLLGPGLRDKSSEPPVVAVDDAGRYAISLLGGRAAGGNRLAEFTAAVLGAEAVVTTAAERLGAPALDETLRRLGWRVADARALARVEAAVINGEPLGFYGPGLRTPTGFGFRRVASPPAMDRYSAGLVVTDRAQCDRPAGWVLVHPRRLVLGFGCETRATAAEALAVALDSLHEAGLAPAAVSRVATIDRRRDHVGALALAKRLEAKLEWFSAAQLDGAPAPNRSERVRAAVGTASVAEAAALLASGGGRLLLPKRSDCGVTIAVAEAT